VSSQAQRIARLQELLELEAEVQRATLAATFAQWEHNRLITLVGGAGRMAVRALAAPRVRWLLLAALLRKLERKERR
jgi:hypothetical protein